MTKRHLRANFNRIRSGGRIDKSFERGGAELSTLE
jgi:hypothetical protein